MEFGLGRRLNIIQCNHAKLILSLMTSTIVCAWLFKETHLNEVRHTANHVSEVNILRHTHHQFRFENTYSATS